MSPKDLFYVGFVSYTLDYLVASAGTAGYSIRIFLFKRRALPVRDILAASVFHSVLNNLLLLVLVPAGFLYLILNHPLPRGTFVGVGLVGGLLLLLIVLAALVIFLDGARALALRSARKAWQTITHRDATSHLEEFGAALACGVGELRKRPAALALLLLLVAADWTFSIGTLEFCFGALRERVGVGVLLTGFSP